MKHLLNHNKAAARRQSLVKKAKKLKKAQSSNSNSTLKSDSDFFKDVEETLPRQASSNLDMLKHRQNQSLSRQKSQFADKHSKSKGKRGIT